ncbi:acetyl-CoA synthetase-like protein [Calocera cornea HHB12733]|uniref:Acetyl-CoA synthetase-like protein n=1 Tax=Calocera cornea HHB12733 TaxID=1353952 RepID=A0A165HNT5_9BASI|nr:acetyl-CoA synthetase-like protein [Calocera cornea HHB12733]
MSSPSPFPTYPRTLTVPQFLLDTPTYPLRPSRLPTSPWLLDDGTGRTYHLEEVRARVERLARAVRERWALGAGDVVALFSANCLDYPIVIWALHRLGCIVTPSNPSYTASELAHQLRETRAKLVFSGEAGLGVALQALGQAGLGGASGREREGERVVLFSPPPPDLSHADGEGCFPPSSPPELHQTPHGSFPTVESLILSAHLLPANYVEPSGPRVGDTVAFLGLSSGTTGLPKAVEVPHRAVLAVVLQIARHCRANGPLGEGEEKWVRPGDRVLGVLPFYHIVGLVLVMHALLFAGAAVVVVPGFRPQRFLETIVKRRITHLPIVPPMVVLLVKSPLTKQYDLSCLRWVLSGAAPLSATILEQFRAILPQARIGLAYGLTETSTLVSIFDPHRPPVPGSSGYIAPDTDARIVLPDGSTAPPGSPGEIWVRGPQMALGYLNNPEATAETFLPDGWVRTGDEGYVREDGSLFVVDRLKELIKVKGLQVAPAELEGHLLLHLYVQDVGVVGIPHDYKGEVPLAFVVLHQSIARQASSSAHEASEIKQELGKWVSEQKVEYKRLEGGIEFVEAIPKNPSGKILRRLLREKAKELVKGSVKDTMAKL